MLRTGRFRSISASESGESLIVSRDGNFETGFALVSSWISIKLNEHSRYNYKI